MSAIQTIPNVNTPYLKTKVLTGNTVTTGTSMDNGLITINGNASLAGLTGMGTVVVNGTLTMTDNMGMQPTGSATAALTVDLSHGALIFGYNTEAPVFYKEPQGYIPSANLPILENLTKLSELVVDGKGSLLLKLVPISAKMSELELIPNTGNPNALPWFGVDIATPITASQIHLTNVHGDAVITFTGTH